MKGYCTMLSMGNYGRAGNLWFQVAGVLGIARKSGLTPVFPLMINKDHRDRFGSAEDCDLYKHFIHPLPSIPEAVRFQDKPIGWGYFDFSLPAGNWNISGHFQSLKYFSHCIDEVKWYLRMKDEQSSDYCALHYRAGDYDTGTTGYHPRMKLNYYEQAIRNFPSDQKYMLFSDDMNELVAMCKQLRINYTISPGKDYIDDFRIMKGCKHFIIANSSFSAMAAILGEAKDKQVIAPSPWFGPAWGRSYRDMERDIYSPGWSVINWEQNLQTA